MKYALDFIDPCDAQPNVPHECDRYVIVAVRRAWNPEKVFTMAATYANNYTLHYDEEPYERQVSGFFTVQSEGEENAFWNPLLGEGDELIAWAEIPQYQEEVK